MSGIKQTLNQVQGDGWSSNSALDAGDTPPCHCEECVSTTSQSYDIEKRKDKPERTGLSFIGALLHRRQIFDWKHHALVLISYVKNLRNRRSLLVPLRGFTLAEVLITLGIIGVVAALTIPTLMQKTNEQETVAKVKSSYSNFSNAFNLAESHYGSADKWTETCGEVYSNNSEEYTQYKLNSTDWVGFKYILDFLKTNKNCGHEEVCFEGANNNTFAHYILANGVPVVFYKHPTRQCQGINIEGGFCATVVIKTDKNPNSVQGKNTFEFGINANKFLPFGYGDLDDSNCLASKDSSCTGYIIRHGNMDYLD
ncbi:type II secretion system protein [bacterium]|nr:type II secretion system protein [bacterium]